MNKRIFAAMLALLLAAALFSSCLQVEDPSLTESGSGSVAASGSLDTPSTPGSAWIGAAATAEAFLNDSAAIVDASKREYSYLEMEADLALLSATYPQYFSYRSFGKSVAGRELYVATLGNKNASRAVLVTAGLHGREYLTPLLAMKQIEFYLHYYYSGSFGGASYAELFSDCCFYIVPMVNPDGVMLSQAGIESLSDPALRAAVRAVYEADKDKGYTSQTDIDNYLLYWKANANGVDLNRNFDALWEDYCMGEPEPCHKNYKGPSPMSEPETRALASLTDSLPPLSAVLCLHSQGEVLYWNCGQEEPLLSATDAFTKAIADRTGYKQENDLNNDASYSDWCALERGLIAITVETGRGLCPLDTEKFQPIWEDNFDLLPLTAAYFRK